MPLVVAAVLVALVHLATGIGAWTGVGLLADDHHMVGAALLRHHNDWPLSGAFAGAPLADASVALYRPFIDVVFWLEYPFFGTSAVGYHITNSLLHCCTALMWFVLIRRWTGSTFAATATAVLFTGWAGHSEATHWIAARVNLLSTCLMSLALLCHDAGLVRRGAGRWLALGAAAVLTAIAIGSKESAVLFVPVMATASLLRTAPAAPWLRRLAPAAATMLPMLAATVAWLAWRAHCLGTWGSGTTYGWHSVRVGPQSCGEWLHLLLAPAHRTFVPAVPIALLYATQIALLLAAIVAVRNAAWRAAAAPAAVLSGLGYLAGVGLQPIDSATLENVRYTYEPALGLSVLNAVGLCVLPLRGRIVALAGLVTLHTVVLDANRQSWLGVATMYARMRESMIEIAGTLREPLRVFDAPGVRDGAFGLMCGVTEFAFWQLTTPKDVELRGSISSTCEWPVALRELASASRGGRLPAPAFTVRWADGSLVPMQLDPQWPKDLGAGATIEYARIARERPFVGGNLPIQVLARSSGAVTLSVVAQVDGSEWSGSAVRLDPSADATPVELVLPLPSTLPADTPVAVGLRVVQLDGSQVVPLGTAVPSRRS